MTIPSAVDRDCVIAYLTRHIGDLTSADAARILTGVAPDQRSVAALERHFTAHPDSVRVPGSAVPLSLVRLAHALRDAGHDEVGLPVCAECLRPTKDLRFRREHGRICQSCWRRTSTVRCARCGTSGPYGTNRAEGLLCKTCHEADPQQAGPCVRCGRARRVTDRAETGLCHECAPRRSYTCTVCGHSAPAQAITDSGPVCRTCYTGPPRECGRCGRVGPIMQRATATTPDLCPRCYQRPTEACTACGRQRPVHGRTDDGRALCQRCSPRPRRTCCRCRRDRPVQAAWPIGPVCSTCYSHTLAHPGHCPRCGTAQPLIGLAENGDRVCGPCCGINVDFTCAECGIVDKLYEKGRCGSCVVIRRLAALLADDTGTIPDRLVDLHRALTTATIGGPSVGWLSRRDGRTTRLLADLARHADQEITHDLLDAVPDHRSADSLRALLVHVGILPDRPEHLDRIEPWLRNLAAELPAHVSQPLRAYARWSVLPRKRARLAARSPQAFTPGAGEHARAKIRAALNLLTWLDGQQLSLDQLTQPGLDRHLLTLTATRRSQLRPFITWAVQHKRASPLQIPAAARHDPHVFLDDTRRTAILRRCLTDAALPLRVRVAGTLVLLFGLTVPRIITLTDQHLTVTSTATHMMLAQRPLLIPPRVATLMVELRDQQHVVHQSAAMPASQPVLLFPGRRPTHTIHPATLARNLRKHGVPIQSSRNTARAVLAEDLPAPVLAELTGLDPTTAGRWAKHVNRAWQPYLAARLDQP